MTDTTAPSLRQAATGFVAFGVLTGGSCATFLQRKDAADANMWAILFVLTAPLAAGACALFVFRLWHRRQREVWPSPGQCLLMAAAGAALVFGGCSGFTLTLDVSALRLFNMAMGAVLVFGATLVAGASELFVFELIRQNLRSRGAR
jgi:hypothetical protein